MTRLDQFDKFEDLIALLESYRTQWHFVTSFITLNVLIPIIKEYPEDTLLVNKLIVAWICVVLQISYS